MPLQRLRGLSTFKRGFASTFTLDVLARAMSAMTLVLLLRALPVDGFAFVILLLSIGQFMGSAATGGLRMRYVRIQAERVSRESDEPSSFYLTLRGGIVLIVAAGALGFLGATALDVGTPEERAVMALIATAYTLGHASIELSAVHYQAHVAFVKAGVLIWLRSFVQFLFAVGATAGLLKTGTAVGAAFAIGVMCVAVATAGPPAWATRKSTVDREGRFGFGRESAALTLFSIATAGRAYINIFLVAALLDDTAVTVYGTATRYISVVMGPVPALMTVMRVRTAQSDMVDSHETQLRLMVDWARRSLVPLIVALGAAAIAAPFVIPLIDEGKYPDTVPVFEIMLVMAFAQLMTLPNPSLLLTQNRYSTLAWVDATVVVVNVLLALAVASHFGVIGIVVVAALVTVGQVCAVTYLAAHPPKGTAGAPAAPLSEGLEEHPESAVRDP
ncbi:MAG TPA: hypothetical protein VHF88_03045 [Thermoleophilaceae bacterium]|nr:hypothetical protein [Thermoleophilaceae bacterium]